MDLKDRVIRNSGGICPGAMSQVDYLINAPVIPEIGRPITLITKGTPTESTRTLLDYIRGDGQKYMAR